MRVCKGHCYIFGHVVGQVRAKVQAIDEYAPLLTKKALMRFLGLVGYYRCFCRNFSTVVAPLTDLLKGKAKYVWSPEFRRHLRVLKP